MAQIEIDRVELGKRIKKTRSDKGIAAKVLASKAGLSASYLSEIERGSSAIAGEKLLRIARQLGVSMAYLLEGDGNSGAEADDVRIPIALAESAEQLNLSYAATMRLLQGRQSLIARRSSSDEKSWGVEDWIDFYKRVKDYIED